MKKKIFCALIAVFYFSLCIVQPMFLFAVVFLLLFLCVNYFYRRILERKEDSITIDFLPQPLFRNNYNRNFDYIALGNSACCLNNTNKCGLNLSVGNQTIATDENILKFYHSYLKKNGYVIFSLSPIQIRNTINNYVFNSHFLRRLPRRLKSVYGDYYSRFAYLLPQNQILTLRKSKLYKQYPLLFCLDRQKEDIVIKDSLSENEITILKNSLEFCRERNYIPVLIIPPISNYFKEKNALDIECFINSIKNTFKDKTLFLDYSSDENFIENDAFFKNNLFLKPSMKDMFTEKVLLDIKKMKEEFSV